MGMTKQSWIKRRLNGNGTAWNKGRRDLPKHSEETKLKMSLAKKGKKPNNFGTTQSKETIEKRIAHFKGNKHWAWIEDRNIVLENDKKDTVEYKQWRLSVYRRDTFKCKIGNGDCKGRIEAHHILPWREYEELRYEINNGITLCHFHHPFKKVDEKRLSPYFNGLLQIA